MVLVGDDLDFAIAHRFTYRSSPRKGGLISLYVDSLGNYLLLLSWLILKHILPPTGTNTLGGATDVIAVNGEERTDRLAIDGYHKGVNLSVSGWGGDVAI
ncbi:hypothetical protein AAEJ74_11205 [Limnospira fusiformis PMC 851.14]|uniref:Uncharacterized protein n=1 Tax=Limnospira fusiformis PMC 851.14 TaxID=2219512 RepID=A0ABU9ELU5_LIMFS